MEGKKRIEYFDFLRVIAMIAVLLYHVKMPTQVVETIVSFLLNWCVPIFLMITGGLFLNNDRQYTLKGVIKKYVLRITGVLVVCGGDTTCSLLY